MTITVIDIDRGRVRLGFEADIAIKIMREELLTQENGHGDGKRDGAA